MDSGLVDTTREDVEMSPTQSRIPPSIQCILRLENALQKRGCLQDSQPGSHATNHCSLVDAWLLVAKGTALSGPVDEVFADVGGSFKTKIRLVFAWRGKVAQPAPTPP